MHSRGVLGNGRSVARKVTLQHSGAGRGKTEPSCSWLFQEVRQCEHACLG